MPTANISASLDLSVNGSKIIIDNSQFLGYSIDLNMSSSNAVGTLNVYAQNTDPTTDTFVRAPLKTYAISGGNFPNSGSVTGITSQTIDSAFLTAAKYCVIVWTKVSGTGTLAAVGKQIVFF